MGTVGDGDKFLSPCSFLILCACASMFLMNTTVSPTKTAELIGMLLVTWTWVAPRNHVLGGGVKHPWGRGSFLGGTSPSQL